MEKQREWIEAQAFDFVLGSLHHPLSRYQDWLREHRKADDLAIIESYFNHLAEGAASGIFHSLSHPDVIRIYNSVNRFIPSELESIIMPFLESVKDCGVCLEVNTSGLIKEAYEMHPDPLILEWIKELDIPLTLGSDAHRPEQVGQKFDEVISILRQTGFANVSYFKNGEQKQLPLV